MSFDLTEDEKAVLAKLEAKGVLEPAVPEPKEDTAPEPEIDKAFIEKIKAELNKPIQVEVGSQKNSTGSGFMGLRGKLRNKKLEAKLAEANKPKINWQGYIPMIAIGALAIIFLSGYLMLQEPSGNREAGILVILLLGGLCFLPVGVFVGWLFLDNYKRCKMMRTVTRKNLGVVQLVAKGKQIISMIKNFDYDVLFIGTAVWVLEGSRVYRITKSNDGIVENESHPIRPEDISTMDGIPTIFLDMSTMRPLSFEKDAVCDPTSLGSTMLGWVANQLAKNMFFKNTFTIMILIAIAVAAISAYFSYMAYNTISDLQDAIPAIKTLAEHAPAIEAAGKAIIEQGTRVISSGG